LIVDRLPTATTDYVCMENTTDTTVPLGSVHATNADATLGSGSLAAVVVVVLLTFLVVRAVGAVMKMTKGESAATGEIPHEVPLQKGAIDDENSDDDDDVPYQGGEFYFLHEKDTEVSPTMHLLRKPVYKAMVKTMSVKRKAKLTMMKEESDSEDSVDSDDGAVQGSYTVNASYRGGDGGAAASAVKLLNTTPLEQNVDSDLLAHQQRMQQQMQYAQMVQQQALLQSPPAALYGASPLMSPLAPTMAPLAPTTPIASTPGVLNTPPMPHSTPRAPPVLNLSLAQGENDEDTKL
jgi:hypothetical protein